MKKTTRLFIVAALAICSTVIAWGQQLTSTVTASKIASSSASWTGTTGETWSVSVNGGATNQNVTNGYAQVGTKNSPSTSITFSTSGISGTISSIVVNCAAYQGAATLSATVGGNSFGTQNQGVPSWSSNEGGDVTFSGSASGAIVITMTNGSNGRAMYIKSITVTYTAGGSTTYTVSYDGNGATSGTVPTDATEYESGDEVTVLANTGSLAKAGYTFGGWNTQDDGNGTNYTAGNTFEISANTTLYAKWNAKTITNLSCTGTPTKTTYSAGESFDPSGLTVTATFNDSSNEDVTSSVSWTPSPLTAGTTSVTGTYMGQSIVVNGLTVTAAPGSDVNNPYTVAQAIANTPSSGTSSDVYIRGIVSAFYNTNDDILDDSYHRYYISDDGTTSSQLLVFNGKALNNVAFSSVNDLLVGDEVIIKGGLTTYNSTKEIAANNYIVSLARNPSITAAPSPLSVPNYVAGTAAEPDFEILIVNGNFLKANITLSLGISSNFEISTDLSEWSNSLTLTQSNGNIANAEVGVRLKAGLTKGDYAGTITLSSTDASDISVNLSGSVTGQTYAISQKTEPANAHGTITFSPSSPIEDGTTVTLLATPSEGYDFIADSWVFYKQEGEEWVSDGSISVTNNKFTMPAYALKVDASFNEKTKYVITSAVNPENSGTIETDGNAWEGKTITVLVEAASGFSFSSIAVTKTGDSSTTISTSGNINDGFTFTMPAYPVTVTATFAEVVDYVELPFEWEGGSSSTFNSITGVTTSGLGSDYAASNNPYLIKFDTTGDYIQIKTDTQPKKATIEVKMLGGTNSSSITVKASSDGITFDEGEELAISGSSTSTVLTLQTQRTFDSSVRYVQFYFTKGSNVGVGPITITKYATGPAVSVEDTSIEAVAAGASSVITVTCSNMDNEPNLEVLFFESDGETSAIYNWVTALINNDNNVAYTIDANIGNERKAYFKVHEKTNDVLSELVTITQAKVDFAALPFEFDGGKSDIDQTFGLTANGLGSDYSSSPKLKFDGTDDYLILKINEVPGVLSFDIKGNSFSDGTFTVQTSSDGETFTDLASYTELSDTQTETFLNLESTIRYIKWIYTEKVNGNVALGNIKLNNTLPATSATVLDESKYVTSFYDSAKSYQLSDGAVAYTVGLVSGTAVFYRIGENSDVIPANTAVVVISDVANIKFTEITNVPEGTTVHAGNILTGTDDEIPHPDGTVYVLGVVNGTLGFYQLKAGISIPAHRAYYVAQ